VYNYHDSRACGYKLSRILVRLDGIGFGETVRLCVNIYLLLDNNFYLLLDNNFCLLLDNTLLSSVGQCLMLDKTPSVNIIT
jgi:hypothetical protein